MSGCLGDNKRKTGNDYENIAASFLRKQGLLILEHSFRVKRGEVDLIARDGEYLVFVEVKYRRGQGSGVSLAAVDKRKQRVISRVAQAYLCRLGDDGIPCRFDVVGIDGKDITWVKNAFDFCG